MTTDQAEQRTRSRAFRLAPPVDWKERLVEAIGSGEPIVETLRRMNIRGPSLYAALREDVNFSAKYTRAKQLAKLGKFSSYDDGSGPSPLAEGSRQDLFMKELASGASLPKVLLHWSITAYALSVVVKRDAEFREKFIAALQEGVRAKWESP